MIARVKLAAIGLLIAALAGSGLPVLAQQRPYRANNWQVRQLVQRLGARTAAFRQSLEMELNNSTLDNTRREERINQFVSDFEASVNRLTERFSNRQTVSSADVQDVLNRATMINNFMRRQQLGGRVETDWSNLRADLDQLAQSYNVSWNWDNQNNYPAYNQGNQTYYPPNDRSNQPYYQQGSGNYYGAARLTGTYRLDPSQSDNAQVVAQRAARNLPPRDRQRLLDTVTARLQAPEMLAIDQRGRNVTLASSYGQQINFEADGREQVEQTQQGRTVRVRAELTGDHLVVNSTGNQGTDYEATFEPLDQGRRLRVTRRIFDSSLTQPIVVQGVYNRVSDTAQMDVYSRGRGYSNQGNSNPGYPNRGYDTAAGRSRGSFYIPDGTELVAVLNNNLSTSQVRDGDRFTMTVRSPGQYEGATIEGSVSNVQRSGRVSGRAGMNLNFERIRLRNGGTYNFTGYIQSVRTPGGEDVRVDTEGNVQDKDSQTGQTAMRAGIGAAVGALIGAIAGGGKGAAIGAAVGAGAGAGSVFIQGRDDLELASGTELTIRVSAPR